MDNTKKMIAMAKVIKSCTTSEQLDSCNSWIASVKFTNTNSIWEATNIKLDLKGLVLDMREYLRTRANVKLLDGVSFGEE